MGRKLVKKEEGAHSVDPQVALFFTGCFIKLCNDELNISTIGFKSLWSDIPIHLYRFGRMKTKKQASVRLLTFGIFFVKISSD